MKLKPEGLGEILVKMTCKSGKVSLEIVTDNALTQKLLQDQSGELKTALGAKNYEVLHMDVVSPQYRPAYKYGFTLFKENGHNNAEQFKNNRNDFKEALNLDNSDGNYTRLSLTEN
jgi:flagellar hook-length control protein FliK